MDGLKQVLELSASYHHGTWIRDNQKPNITVKRVVHEVDRETPKMYYFKTAGQLRKVDIGQFNTYGRTIFTTLEDEQEAIGRIEQKYRNDYERAKKEYEELEYALNSGIKICDKEGNVLQEIDSSVIK